MTVLVDSDILIEVMRARNAEILKKWADLAASQDGVLCSPVSIAELWHGAHPREHDMLANLFHAMTCVPIDAQVGRKAGEFLRAFRKSHSLELGDALIAASVVITGAALWTRNRKHYPMRALTFF
jgi:predicted nucleic acid-binding protein